MLIFPFPFTHHNTKQGHQQGQQQTHNSRDRHTLQHHTHQAAGTTPPAANTPFICVLTAYLINSLITYQPTHN